MLPLGYPRVSEKAGDLLQELPLCQEPDKLEEQPSPDKIHRLEYQLSLSAVQFSPVRPIRVHMSQWLNGLAQVNRCFTPFVLPE